ncbi:MAG: HNH endonuclease [Gammaproteobacteria bacterium]
MTSKFVLFQCLNCDAKLLSSGLYCPTGPCREEAEFVRYVRRCKKDGRIDQPDVQEAIQIRLAWVQAGGYRQLGRDISRKIREAVTARDGGRCVKCRAPANEIDHIHDSSDELENLQLLCHACHIEKTMAGMAVISPDDARYEKYREIQLRLFERIDAKRPKRICDGEVSWSTQYHGFMKQAREELNKKACGELLEKLELLVDADLLIEMEDLEEMQKRLLEGRKLTRRQQGYLDEALSMYEDMQEGEDWIPVLGYTRNGTPIQDG